MVVLPTSACVRFSSLEPAADSGELVAVPTCLEVRPTGAFRVDLADGDWLRTELQQFQAGRLSVACVSRRRAAAGLRSRSAPAITTRGYSLCDRAGRSEHLRLAGGL